MTVLSVAYPLAPVGPGVAGGAEQVLWSIERALADGGCRSIVIAAQGSEVSAELIETPVFDGEITDEIRRKSQAAHLRAIEEALQRYSIDLIHFHGLDFYAYLPGENVPMLATLHLPISFYPQSIFALDNVVLNCVSRAQANSARHIKNLPVVLNGIPTQQYRTCSQKQDFLLWLGRICPEKGVHIALQVAHRLDMPLMLAGMVGPYKDHQTYFSDCVKPLLDHKRQYIGPVGLETKAALLSAARCLLIPSLVAETSSLVAMEAISSGTAVVAFNSGALPEVVDHGETGYIVNSEDQMIEAIRCIDEISPEICRSRASARFDVRQMVSGYLDLYASLRGLKH